MNIKIMMKISATAGMIAILLAGCSLPVPREINPPRNAQYITVKGKVPSHTKPSIFTHYTSLTCQFKTIHMGSGARGKENYKLAKFAEIDFNEKTGEFRAELPIDGGTHCNWSLGSFSVDIEYANTTHLLNTDAYSYTGGIKVNLSPECERNIPIYVEKLAVFPQYYPVQRIKYIDGEERSSIQLINIKSMNNLGRYKDNYQLLIPKYAKAEVIYNPTIDEHYLVKQIDKGNTKDDLSVIYPDGTRIERTNTIKPYPKDKREQALKEQKRLQESMGIFPIDLNKNPDACKNL